MCVMQSIVLCKCNKWCVPPRNIPSPAGGVFSLISTLEGGGLLRTMVWSVSGPIESTGAVKPVSSPLVLSSSISRFHSSWTSSPRALSPWMGLESLVGMTWNHPLAYSLGVDLAQGDVVFIIIAIYRPGSLATLLGHLPFLFRLLRIIITILLILLALPGLLVIQNVEGLFWWLVRRWRSPGSVARSCSLGSPRLLWQQMGMGKGLLRADKLRRPKNFIGDKVATISFRWTELLEDRCHGLKVIRL